MTRCVRPYVSPRRRRAPSISIAAVFIATAFFSPRASADTFLFSADKMDSVMAEGKERALLSGNAHLQADDLKISADAIELSGKNWRYARCSGNVVAADDTQGIRITTETLIYDRETRISRLEGDSILEDFKNKVVLKAFWIENDDMRKFVSARIGVRVFKEKTSARSASLSYRRDEQTLELTGAARVLRKGDEYEADRILLNLDTDEITLLGGVSGTVVKKKEEKPSSETPGNPPSPNGDLPPDAPSAPSPPSESPEAEP